MAIEFVAGDTGSKLVVTCKDEETKLVIDLTGMTAKLRYSISGAAAVERNMTIQNPATAGKAEYQFLADDLSEGEVTGEVVITDAQAKKITQLIPFRFAVRAPVI